MSVMSLRTAEVAYRIAKKNYDRTMEEISPAVLKAYEDGYSIRYISQATGLTCYRVQEILKTRNSSERV